MRHYFESAGRFHLPRIFATAVVVVALLPILFPPIPLRADAFCVGANACALFPAVPNCPDTGGNHLNFSSTTLTWTCGTSGGGGLVVGTTAITNGAANRILFHSAAGDTVSEGAGFTTGADGSVQILGSSSSSSGILAIRNNLGANAVTTYTTGASALGGTLFGSVSTNSLSTILVSGSQITGLAIGSTTSDPIYFGTNGTLAATIDTSQNATFTAGVTSSATSSIGWSNVSVANQDCNTTCTSACVFGFNVTAGNVTGLPLACTDATSDVCVCAGAS